MLQVYLKYTSNILWKYTSSIFEVYTSKRTPKKTTFIWVKELCNNSFKFNQMKLCRIILFASIKTLLANQTFIFISSKVVYFKKHLAHQL